MASSRLRTFLACVRLTYYAVNIVFWMVGLSLMGIGLWLQLTRDEMVAMAPGYAFVMPGALCMAAGCLTLIVAFLGCCGALVDNHCMLTTYVFLAIIVFGLQVTAGLSAILSSERLEREIYHELRASLTDRYPQPLDSDNRTPPVRAAQHRLKHGWDIIQSEGCIRATRSLLESHLLNIGIVLLAFAFFQMMAIAMSAMLVCMRRRNNHYTHQRGLY